MLNLLYGRVVLGASAGPARADNSLESQLPTRLGKAVSLSAGQVNVSQIVKRDVAYSGIAVAAIKTDNLLELFNPFAPDRYGSAADNTLLDPGTGKARAWKLFSIQF